MRERRRVEILRNRLAAQGFLFIADLTAAAGVSVATARRGVQTLLVDHGTRVTEAA
jgi:DeoR/GlpR family transcriptional regulator of sugar metabolism